MSIEVQGITKLYGTQKAVNLANFFIETGEVVGLLGPNGAGKSTLMKIITCYLPPTSGKAFVCGHDVLDESIQVRSKIGYLPEHNPLYLDMYVHEFLNFIASIHKIKNKKQRVAEMIELIGLDIEQKKKIGHLSKGYRQRVGLAQALMHDPEVLVLDEPTSGLDPNQIMDIRSLIRNIGKEKTVLLSTHIMQEVEAICSRAIIIDQGIIVADDKLENISSGFSSDYVIVEFDINVISNDILQIKGVKSCNSIKENTWKIETSDNIDIRKELFKWAVSKNLTILSLEKEKTSIEDVFHKLTKK